MRTQDKDTDLMNSAEKYRKCLEISVKAHDMVVIYRAQH